MIYPRAAESLTLCIGLFPCALIYGLSQATAGAVTALVTVPISVLHFASQRRTGLLLPVLRSATPSNPPATCKTWDPPRGSLQSHSSTAKQRFHTPGPKKPPEVS